LQIINEGVLFRIGKKQQNHKEYYYKIISNYLLYYKLENKTDTEAYIGFIYLDVGILMSKKEVSYQDTKFYMIEITRGNLI